jgi:hypothetical protein
MRVIQNEMVAFRCPNTLKERLNEIALTSDMHVSQVVRIACAELVFRRSQTGIKDERQPIACG